MITRRLHAGDICFGNGLADFLTGLPAVKQKIKTKLYLLKGEWFLNLDAGFPWQLMGGSPAQRPEFEATLKGQILSIPGVDSLTFFEVIPQKNRFFSIHIGLKTIQGEGGHLEFDL